MCFDTCFLNNGESKTGSKIKHFVGHPGDAGGKNMDFISVEFIDKVETL